MKQVLIIDDATTVRMYHRQILNEAGFAVDECINGVEALEKALSVRYDLFIVDVNMPKMDGLTFLRELRARGEVHQAPAIMVSTEAEERDHEAAFAAGANFYLTKPTKPGALARAAALLTGGTP
ncbi:two-component system response regulator [Xaviernesmea oryzae]|uniref:Two-component system response regulator n=1 Tax=Xaviernesmea oryzae TaxID=464029 RepID=A0A1Q9B1C6_9HYPH|nr:response regulator [Xaviernesmea oryzae]OLP61803.1 two-component system response regulator [Xaviernesmea oryzae]SEL76861.1 two-component system, chemotaxis family, response regulator CheY [Xaviernesmea oryzae]